MVTQRLRMVYFSKKLIIKPLTLFRSCIRIYRNVLISPQRPGLYIFAELLADPRPLVGQPGQNFHGPDFDRYRDGAVDHPVERDFDRPVQPPVVQPQGFLSKQERKDFREMPLRAMTVYFRVTVDERAQMRFHSFRVCRERVFQSIRRAESDSRVGIGAQIDRLGEQALTSDQSTYPLPEAGRRSDGQDLSQLFACHKCSG